jgi:hypothetical protein
VSAKTNEPVASPIPAHRSLLIAQSLKLELTLEFAMRVSHGVARVRKLKAQGSKLKAQGSKLRARSSSRCNAMPVIRDPLLKTRRYLNPNIPILNEPVIALQ